MKKTSLQILALFVITLVLFFIFFCLFKGDQNRKYEALYISVMVVTACVIGIQSWATKQLAESQMMPVIDVNMLYNATDKDTFFWFYNSSIYPAFVKIEAFNDGKITTVGPLRISPLKQPNYIRHTAGLNFSLSEVNLNIQVSSAIEKNSLSYNFKKNYRFKNGEWYEQTWDFPDDPFPGVA